MTLRACRGNMQDLQRMVTASGQLTGPSVFLTREVRWFFDGPLPPSVLDWFTGRRDVEVEHRIDHYDLGAARRGIGLKRRGTTSVDSKFRVLLIQNVDLGRGLKGHIEDWMKISEPLGNGVETDIAHPIEISKKLYTRRFGLNGADGAGCEAELAAITAGSVDAWSLCFETYGPPAEREAAFMSGIGSLLAISPLPSGMRLGPESCHGYPEWINSLAVEAA